MRRFTGLPALVAILLMTLAPARADQTYTADVPFQANGQSMWPTPAGMSADINLTTGWNVTFEEQARKHIDVVGTFSVGATGESRGNGGLILSQYARGGTVDVAYPLTLALTYPDLASLSPGKAFTLRSSWVPGVTGAAPNLSTKSPRVGLAANARLNVEKAKLRITGRAFGEWVFRETLFDSGGFGFNQRVFDTDWPGVGFGLSQLANGLTVNVTPAALDSSGSATGDGLIRTSARSQILSISGSFTNALAAQIPNFPGFAKSFNYSYSGAGIRGNYRFLSLEGTVPVSVSQFFQFSARPRVRLSLSTGQIVDFNAGESVQLTMPSDGSALRITPAVTLDNQFRNQTGLGTGGSLDFHPFSISGRVSWPGHSISLDYALPSQTIVSGGFSGIVYDKTFALGGFQPKTLPDLVLTPPAPPAPVPPTLTANHDAYWATTYSLNGVPLYRVGAGYTGTSAPGVLANDTGSVSFEAVPQEWHDELHPDEHYFRLDRFGRVDFSVPADVVGEGKQFNFPYQITDGKGHFATGSISITAGPNGGG